MKKVLIFTTVIVMFLCAPKVKAANVKGTVIGSDVLAASSPNQTKPGNSCSYMTGGRYSSAYASPNLRCLDTGDQITIYNYDSIIQSTISSCKKGYYKFSYTWPNGNTYNGYVCADNVTTSIDTSKYATEFKNAGLPEIYWDKLSLLKEAHPNWKFTGYNTGLNWDTVLKKEAGGWYAANKNTVAYYMDPRNFMDEKSIFMFENLGYNSKYMTLEAVQKILKNTKLYDNSSDYIKAASQSNVSPIMLAALSKQEVVLSDGSLSNSANGKNGYYNAYNLGAFSSCDNPVKCAIDFASGYNGQYATYNRPWKDLSSAIINGAAYIANGYISSGQNTLYFKKYNVTKKNTYSNQYQTNIMAPISEARSTYDAYSSISGLLDSTIEFVIPVYNNMPSTVSTLPTKVDEKQKEEIKEEQNNVDIVAAINKAGYSISGSYLVNVKIGTKAKDILNKIKGVTITSDGKTLTGNEVLGTADVITFNNNSYRIVIKGDVNGDGKITPADYVRIKNSIMKTSSLSAVFTKAADVNNDNKVTPADYVNVKNYIMGSASTLK